LIPDETLFGQLVRGDLAAFDALYARHERPLFGYVLGHLGDRQEAEDVIHDAFLAVLRDGRRGTAPDCFRAWLYQVARNLCLNRLRGRSRAARALGEVARAPAPTTPRDPGADLAARQTTVALHAAVERLPVQLAELFRLRSSGLSYEELAQVLELPLGTVKSRIHDMVTRLRQELTP
jgi:RNA polymerase sigma-70 factor (ECF subfamily)